MASLDEGEWIDISGDGGILKKITQAAPEDATTPEQVQFHDVTFANRRQKLSSKAPRQRDGGRAISFAHITI